jgi:hypothetical protein
MTHSPYHVSQMIVTLGSSASSFVVPTGAGERQNGSLFEAAVKLESDPRDNQVLCDRDFHPFRTFTFHSPTHPNRAATGETPRPFFA